MTDLPFNLSVCVLALLGTSYSATISAPSPTSDRPFISKNVLEVISFFFFFFFLDVLLWLHLPRAPGVVMTTSVLLGWWILLIRFYEVSGTGII